MSYALGGSSVPVANPGVAGSENSSLQVWTPAYQGFSAWNYDPAIAGTNAAAGTTTCWAYRIYCPTAFTATKIGYHVNTAISGGTAAHATTVAAGSNGVDVTTFAGAGSLVVADSSSFTAAGTALLACVSGSVWISYTSKADGTHLSGVTTLQSGTGILATGGAVSQSLNTMGLFNDGGTTMLGILADQVTNWGTSGFGGAGGVATTMVTPNGTSAAITAGSYVWVVQLGTSGTTNVNLRVTGNNSIVPNNGITDVSKLRVGKVAAADTYFRAPSGTATVNTFVPGSMTNANSNSPGYPWVALL